MALNAGGTAGIYSKVPSQANADALPGAFFTLSVMRRARLWIL